jgi:hypothetical protein
MHYVRGIWYFLPESVPEVICLERGAARLTQAICIETTLLQFVDCTVAKQIRSFIGTYPLSRDVFQGLSRGFCPIGPPAVGC